MTRFERLFWMMLKPWVFALVVLFVTGSFFYLDRPIAEWIHNHQAQFQPFWPWLNKLTNIGFGMFYVIFLLVMALFCHFIFHNRIWAKRFGFLWLSVTVPSLVCLFLKTIIGRARPELWFSEQLYGFFGPHKKALFLSFPSGHTTTIMGLMFGLSALFPRHCVALVAFGVLIASSRILLVQHYLSDVVTASYLALIEVGLIYYFLKSRWLARLMAKWA